MLELPTWVKGRQGKVQELGPARYKITGPNLPEAVVGARIADSLRWVAYMRDADAGPDVVASGDEFEHPLDALRAAFELYRVRYVV